MANSLVSKVEELSKSKPVFIFMKGTPDFPQCGFSARAVQVLKMAGAADLGAFDVLSDDPMWGALEELTNWPTVPQIFVNGKFVGGCDIVCEMYERGELQELVQKK
ncbi:MAG: Grx4 family monothiol glutaredoxin [Deltaproteobacteria bacterium]|nr:Grx4 family monothiol glutaredoxin [Deltaproteobacteria bacterium]